MNRNLIFLLLVLIVIGISVGVFIITNDSDDAESTPDTPTIPTIGLLVQSEEVGLFLKFQLAELGYVEGETIQYMEQFILDSTEEESAVQAMIEEEVDIIFSSSPTAASIAGNLTTTIPVVFMADEIEYTSDIVPQIDELANNVTGVITVNATEKRFDLLMQVVPSIEVLYVPYDPNNALSVDSLQILEASAERAGVTLEEFQFTNNEEGQRALMEMPEDVDAIFLGSEATTLLRIDRWAELSLLRGKPAILPLGQVPGGFFPPALLMGYGAGVDELYEQVAELIDQLLQGTAPADLPLLPSDLYLIISLGAADAFDIEIPDSILDQANEIVREEVVISTASTADALVESDESCNANLVSPIGANLMCVSSPCDTLEDTAFLTYEDRETVESCSTEGYLGICSYPDNDAYFYSGDTSPMEVGCPANGGEWIAVSD